MKPFLDHNFLLQNNTAERLYHEYAAELPIIDYHNHLSPEEVATDHRFQNITEVWLDGDHYKWRAMRAAGVGEQFITRGGITPGKIQWGSAWWFLGQKDDMEKEINALSKMGLLSQFVGMLTDGRSFLSFPRHEYFRRILCNLIGEDVHAGLLPNDLNLLGEVVGDVCYHNARRYFGFYEDQNVES